MLTVFIGFMSRLFVTQVRALENANRTIWVIGRFDNLVAQMRKDVWNSTEVKVWEDGGAVEIHHRQGRRSIWAYLNNRMVRKVFQDSTEVELNTWNDLGWEPRFEMDGAVLVLTLPAGTPHGGRRIRFQSQLQLATKGGS